MAKDLLGSRMKDNYENRSRHYLTRRIPVIVRVDGKAFHTLTKSFHKPFDARISQAMYFGACKTLSKIQGGMFAYFQSDECSFIINDFQTLETQAYFNYNKSKIESIISSMFTGYFNKSLQHNTLGFFDARSFNIPIEEVPNYLIWRIKDCIRNSISSLAQSHFSAKELLGLSQIEQLDILKTKNIVWDKEIPSYIRYGILLDNKCNIIIPEDHSYAKIEELLYAKTQS